jgi:hypothetical protein
MVDVVIANGVGATTRERVTDFVWAGLDESVTLKDKLAVPTAVGVPEMTPLLGAKLRPVGRVPEVMDQVYGPVPPVALRVPL